MDQDAIYTWEEVSFWIADGAIHFKITSPYHDPIEFNADVAREIANNLLRMADALDKEDEE